MRVTLLPARSKVSSSSVTVQGAQRTLHRHVIRLGLLAVVSGAYVLVGNSSNLFLFNTCLLAGVGAIALNFLMGTVGQPSLGTTAFLGLGGFATVALMHQGIPFVPAVILSSLIAALGGLVLGLPSLRMRGVYLALATLGAYFFMDYFGQQYQDSAASPVGFVVQPFFASSGPLNQQRYWCLVLFGILALTSIFVEEICTGRIGRALRMVRDHELAAPALGIPVTRYKLSAFMLYALLTAMAGGIGAAFVGTVSTDSYTLTITISYVVMVYIGGVDSVTGSIVGAFIITLLPTFVSDESTTLLGASFAASYGTSVSEGIYGLAILVLVTSGRSGLAGLGSRVWRELVRMTSPRAMDSRDTSVQEGIAVAAASPARVGEGTPDVS